MLKRSERKMFIHVWCNRQSFAKTGRLHWDQGCSFLPPFLQQKYGGDSHMEEIGVTNDVIAITSSSVVGSGKGRDGPWFAKLQNHCWKEWLAFLFYPLTWYYSGSTISWAPVFYKQAGTVHTTSNLHPLLELSQDTVTVRSLTPNCLWLKGWLLPTVHDAISRDPVI